MLDTYPHADALAEAVATAITARLAEALRERGRASLVGTGGRSPGVVYDRLRAADLDWTRIAVTLSDDRCVPPDDADSNQKLLRDRLLQGAAARAPVVSLWPRPDP